MTELLVLLGTGAMAGAIGLVTSVRSAFAGALCLGATLLSLAGVSVLLEAYLVAIVQIGIGVGAIVVMFSFALFQADPPRPVAPRARLTASRLVPMRVAACALAVLVLGQLIALLIASPGPAPALPEGFGGYRGIGALLFTRYVLVFEAISLLLLSTTVAVVVLAGRDDS